jgi:hypothetical protein
MSSSDLAWRQLVNTFSFVFWGQLQDLVTSPATRDRMSRLSPSYIQDFLRLILLVSLLGEWNFKVPDVAWIIKKKQITLL